MFDIRLFNNNKIKSSKVSVSHYADFMAFKIKDPGPSDYYFSLKASHEFH